MQKIVDTGFYGIGSQNELFDYWRNEALSYDCDIDWDDIRNERLFWLSVIYTLCDQHYETGLFRVVRHIMIEQGFNQITGEI